MRIPSGVTDQVINFLALDATDLVTRETGLTTFTVYRSRNGGTATAFTTPTVTELDATNAPGIYKLLLDEDMTITAGNDSEEFVLHITHSSMAPVSGSFELYRREVTAGATIDVTAGAVDSVTLVATTTTNSDMRGTDSAATAVNLTTVDTVVDAILTDTGTTIPALIGALPTAAEIETEVWDAAASGHNTGGTFGKLLRQINEGLIAEESTINDAGASTTVFITALAEASDDHYNDTIMVFIDGALKGQARTVLNYTGASKTITLDEALTEAPGNGDGFLLIATHVHPVTQIQSGLATEAKQDTAQTAIDAIPTTAMRGTDSAALASVATEARLAELDAANLPADVDAVLADTNELQTDWANGGRLDNLLDGATAPTAAVVADAVWDELQSSHTDAGSFGLYVDSKISDAGASGGSGAFPITITLTDGTDPIESANVRIYQGVSSYVLATDASGNATYNLDSGTYSISATKAGYSLASGTTGTATGSETGTLVSVDIEMSLDASVSPPPNADMCRVSGFFEQIDGTVSGGVRFDITLVETGTNGVKSERIIYGRTVTVQTNSSGQLVSDGNAYIDLQRNDILTPAGSVYHVTSPDMGLDAEVMTLTTATYDLLDLIGV